MNEFLEDIETDEDFDRRLMRTVVRMPFRVFGVDEGRLDTTDGKLLDYWGDEGVCPLGYSGDELRSAFQQFTDSAQPFQLPDVYPHTFRWLAAEILCERTGMDRAFFSNSGTEANEAAIKLARRHWFDRGQEKRFVVLTVEGNFHGRSGLSIAASDPRVSPHHTEGFGPIAQGFGVLAYDDDEFLQVVTDGVEHDPTFPKWDEVAAVILAPVLGNNTVKTYPSDFWRTLEAVRAKTDTLIIHDDVQAGSGRAGEYASWQATESEPPDILTLGKGLALGFPMSATLARDGVAESFTPGSHFNTFGGSPFVCFLATFLFKWLDENIDGIKERGRVIRHFFAQRDCWIQDFDGAGLLNAFKPDFDRFGYDGFEFCREARRHGLGLVTHRARGMIRFIPRLNAPLSEIKGALALLERTHFELRDKALKEHE